MPTFQHGSLTLNYEIFGGPEDRTVVFLHGLLLSTAMMEPLARAFSERFRVVNFELHGHGKSSKPTDPGSYTMSAFADDVVALADHLGCDKIGIFGTSLGADVGLEAMLNAPRRVAGAVLEMPVLDTGARTAIRVFARMAKALRSKRAPRLMKTVANRMPSWPPGFPEAAEMLAADPVAGAAVIEGLLREAERDRWAAVRTCSVPALVIGHRLDPLHAYRDAVHLASRLPNGYLLKARSILEMRLRPGRILQRTMDFMDGVFEGLSSPLDVLDEEPGEAAANEAGEAAGEVAT
ncbi:MAG TPA: alpha/beta hydrolase [Actinomycetota bacterium]|nr:alpha/beta hydrolase [Actinomycetota bacterium]